MAGTPPARSSINPTTPLAMAVLPRSALEYLPLPLLIFEPTLRLNFINAVARRFFGLEGSLHSPETLGISAHDLFGEDVAFVDPEDTRPGESIEVGEWNERVRNLQRKERGSQREQIRMLECRRRHKPDSAPVTVRAAVGPFMPSTEYFSLPQPTSTHNWHSVVLMSMPSSPVSSSASTMTPLVATPAERSQQRRTAASPYAQFAANAHARTPLVLRGTGRQPSTSALSPSGRPPRSSQHSSSALGTPASFFPSTPASSLSSGSGATSTSSAVASSYAPSTAESTAPSLGEQERPSLASAPSTMAIHGHHTPSHELPPMSPRPVRPAPGPSKTSPAAAVIEQIRAADRMKETERERREKAEEDERKQAYARTPKIPSPSVPGTPMKQPSVESLDAPSASAALPGLGAAHPLTTLTHSALSHLPRTGIILASTDLSGGYVNAVARELLLGVRTQEIEEEDSTDWMTEGIWLAQPGPGGKWTWDGAEFFRGLDANAPVSQTDADDSSSRPSVTHRDSESTSATTGGFSVGLPTQLYKMTVATILQRSVKLSKVRRKAMRKRMAGSADAAAALSALALDDAAESENATPSMPSTSKLEPPAPLKSSPRTNYFNPSSTPTPTPEHPQPSAPKPSRQEAEPKASNNQSRKPYKVYDSTFYQRIIDPLEPLLEMCARRGLDPDMSLGGNSGMVVGLEVDIPESDATFATFETNAVGASKRKVRRRLVEVKGVVIRHPNGTHMGGMLVLRDVTDEKTSEGSRPRTVGVAGQGDEYFKQILDQMPQMVWTTTPQGSHDYFNNQWYEYTGLEPEQSLGLGWQNPFHDDDMPHSIKAWSQSLATGEPYSTEYRCRRHDGVWRWMLGRALPMRNSDGQITGWFGTCTDIEDAVEIRAQLLRTREQFVSVLSGADVTIISTDLVGAITLVEGADAAMLRQRSPTNEATTQLFTELWPQDEQLLAVFDQVKAGETNTGRLESIGPNGRPYRVSIRQHSTIGADGKSRTVGYIIVCNDVADLKDAELALKESVVERTRLLASETAAKEASRLKSAWLANTTHEIRTPISAMVGLAELLLGDGDLAAEHRDSVEKILRSCEILLDMVGMVLDMGKVEAGKLELDEQEFFLDDALADARIFSHVAFRKGLEYRERKEVAYEGPLIGDMPRLRQILGNILSNAIKFTSSGSIDFHIKSTSDSADGITITFVVTDTGIGIKAEAVPLLFQPFQQADNTTSRRFGGTGLGLSIVKSLVDLMGGKVEMRSTYGKGTALTVEVPFRKPATSSATSRRAISSPPKATGDDLDRSNVWILLAEDNELNRDIVIKLLQRLRFNVEAVENGHRVLDIIKKRDWDLVLMDGQMPDLDGYETTRRLREDPDLRQLKIVALTASAVQGTRERCLEAGMDDYLAKPVRLKDLEAMVLKHLLLRMDVVSAGASSH